MPTRVQRLDGRAGKTEIIAAFADIDGIDPEAVYRHVRDTVNARLPAGWTWEPATSELLVPDGADINDVDLHALIDEACEAVDIEDPAFVMLPELAQAHREHVEMLRRATEAAEARNRLLLEAIDAGHTHAQIAGVLGVSRSRVNQIVQAARRGA